MALFGNLPTRFVIASFVGGAALILILVLMVVWFCRRIGQRGGSVGSVDAAPLPEKSSKSKAVSTNPDLETGPLGKEAGVPAQGDPASGVGGSKHRVKKHHDIEVLDVDPFGNTNTKANPLFTAFESPVPRPLSSSVSSPPLTSEFGFGDIGDNDVRSPAPAPPTLTSAAPPTSDHANGMSHHTSFKDVARETVANIHAVNLPGAVTGQPSTPRATTPAATTPTAPAAEAMVVTSALPAAETSDASAVVVADPRQARIVAMREARERKKREEEDLLMQALTILDNLTE